MLRPEHLIIVSSSEPLFCSLMCFCWSISIWVGKTLLLNEMRLERRGAAYCGKRMVMFPEPIDRTA